MSCVPTITLAAAATLAIVSGGAPSIVTAGAPALVLQLQQSPVVIEAPQAPAIVIEVCAQGPPGPPGLEDPVWIIKPDATLTYDGDGRLIRVDYADGTFKDLTYNGGGLLIEVSGENMDGDTVTKTLAYDGDENLTSVSTVIT